MNKNLIRTKTLTYETLRGRTKTLTILDISLVSGDLRIKTFILTREKE